MAENNDIKAEGEQKSVWGLLKKVLKWVAIVGVIVIGLLAWAGNNLDVIDEKIQTWQAERYDRAMQKIADKKIAQYAADKDGGKTPEETLDLFIGALKVGDIEKASKYYVLDKQEETLKDLRDEIAKYGDLHLGIDFFTEVKENGAKGCNKEGNGCTFEYEYIRTKTSTTTAFISGQNLTIVSPAGSKGTKMIDLGLNPYSNVWKIELP